MSSSRMASRPTRESPAEGRSGIPLLQSAFWIASLKLCSGRVGADPRLPERNGNPADRSPHFLHKYPLISVNGRRRSSGSFVDDGGLPLCARSGSRSQHGPYYR